MSTNNKLIFKITLSGMFLALGLLLPFLTGQIPEIGSMLCPMHLPVIICGFICGWKYGLVIGFTTPILRYFLFQMPPIYPTGLSMSFELATYGLLAGIFYQLFIKNNLNNLLAIYITLIIAMIGGRLIWGTTRYIMTLIDETLKFPFEVFISGAFITAWPGIILQLILIPSIMFALDKANLLKKLN